MGRVEKETQCLKLIHSISHIALKEKENMCTGKEVKFSLRKSFIFTPRVSM